MSKTAIYERVKTQRSCRYRRIRHEQKVPPLPFSAVKRTPEDIINHVAARAERRAGYKVRKMGWLSWFGKVLNGQESLLQRLRHAARLWPPLEREIFEFYFVDRLALADIALIAGCTPPSFHANLLFIQRRLREALVKEALSESGTAVLNKGRVFHCPSELARKAKA